MKQSNYLPIRVKPRFLIKEVYHYHSKMILKDAKVDMSAEGRSQVSD